MVATASLGWQVWNGYRAKRPQVTLLLDRWRYSQASGRRIVESAEIRIRNREDYTIRIERLYFKFTGPTLLVGSPIAAEIEGGEVDAIPFEVPPREVISLTLRPEKTAFKWRYTSGSEPTPVVGMELRTGERYISQASRR